MLSHLVRTWLKAQQLPAAPKAWDLPSTSFRCVRKLEQAQTTPRITARNEQQRVLVPLADEASCKWQLSARRMERVASLSKWKRKIRWATITIQPMERRATGLQSTRPSPGTFSAKICSTRQKSSVTSTRRCTRTSTRYLLGSCLDSKTGKSMKIKRSSWLANLWKSLQTVAKLSIWFRRKIWNESFPYMNQKSCTWNSDKKFRSFFWLLQRTLA